MWLSIAIAVAGILASVYVAWFTSRLQHGVGRSQRLLDAKLNVFGECTSSLYEFQRATFARVRARTEAVPEAQRDILRQEAYRANSRTRAAIGQVAILSGSEFLQSRLERARAAIADLNKVSDYQELTAKSREVHKMLYRVTDAVRLELAKR